MKCTSEGVSLLSMATDNIPQRPYLFRAMHEWMTDSGHTPHVVVDAAVDGVVVPKEYIKDDKIVLNISYAAAHNLDIDNERIEFEARFGGVPQRVAVPMQAVLGIYARETGQGMIFSDTEFETETADAR